MTQASWPATTYAELAEIIRRNETAGDAARRFARGGRLIPDSILAARITDAIKRGKIPPRPPEYARIKAERMAARRERKKKAAAQKSRKPDAVTFDSPTTATAFLKSLVARGYQRELARPLQPGQFDVLHNAGVSIQILFVERASDDRWAARELSHDHGIPVRRRVGSRDIAAIRDGGAWPPAVDCGLREGPHALPHFPGDRMMTIPWSEALVCAETTCLTLFWQREYPDARCPLCGSEAIHLAASEARRATLQACKEFDETLGELVERMRSVA